ncbi:hypothetical protein KBC80_03235 [Candidatus Woesebacteria bacterium]|nr:hypothetical protein [Candidatus Woesebacteria bacterium]
MQKMQKIGTILRTFNPLEDKYISREFQAYGVYLSEILDDYKHKALYIRLAKTVPRAILEKALSFVKDSKARSKGRLFMWKLKELRTSVDSPVQKTLELS